VLALAFAISQPVSAGGLPPAAPESVGLSGERLERLEAMMEQYVERGELAGAVVLVARNGRTVFSAAVGSKDLEAGQAMQRDTIFRIASMTKLATSVAALIL
jgi:CubicO group peptidase (beta-lactamase class C family)